MAQFNFDPTQYEPSSAPEALPPGWYPAQIVESEIVETKNKDGFRLKLTWEIIDGPGKGRKIPSGHNIQNPNQQTVEIAMREITSICTCVGIFTRLSDSQQLHGRPAQIKLKKQSDSEYNEICGFRDIHGNDPNKITRGAASAPAAMMQTGAPAYGAAAPQMPQQQGFAPQQYGAPAPAQYGAPAYDPNAQASAAPSFAPQQPPAPAVPAGYAPQQPQQYGAPAAQQMPWAPPTAQPYAQQAQAPAVAAPPQGNPAAVQTASGAPPAWTPGNMQAPAWMPQQ